MHIGSIAWTYQLQLLLIMSSMQWAVCIKLSISASDIGVVLQNVWSEVLRCVSRWELLQQLHSGGPTDALLFSPPPAESPASNPLLKLRDRLLMRSSAPSRHFSGNLLAWLLIYGSWG